MPYTHNGVRYNDDGTVIGPASFADYGAASPFGAPLTEADIKRLQNQANIEFGTQAGIGLGLGAAQLGLSLYPTQADDDNKAKLAALQEREKRGELGLTAGERQRYERTLMDPVRAIAGEQTLAEEAAIAASGQGQSAANITRARREERKRLDEASIQAGQRIEEAHAAEAQREAMELSERLATEANRERERISMIGQTVAGLAAAAGKVVAAGARKTDITDGQIMQMIASRGKDGKPLYPGLHGKSIEEARALLRAGDTSKIFGEAASYIAPSTAGSSAAPLADGGVSSRTNGAV